ncbi:hypothetical protein K438DRAFT_1949085 [Mycena galopus ATCC 62051]|nr:hypothetical protein K438DRAFT_1949085 [Mycena galopus ATCC 62051]
MSKNRLINKYCGNGAFLPPNSSLSHSHPPCLPRIPSSVNASRHLGHNPVTDAVVLARMDPWVNEHPSPEEDPEAELYISTMGAPPSIDTKPASQVPTNDSNGSGIQFQGSPDEYCSPTASNNPPFPMLLAFIQTQSRNNTENHSLPSGSTLQRFSSDETSSSRREVEPLRMKQEPNEHKPNTIFPNARHHQQQSPSLIPQPQNEMKTQSNKLRTFTMMAPTPTYDEYHHRDSSQPPYHRRPSSVLQSRSLSLQLDQDFDADDADLSQLMTKRLREAKVIKSKLAEQHLATAALESRLCAQTTASEAAELALKNRISDRGRSTETPRHYREAK